MKAVALGLRFGAVEALLLGASSGASAAAALRAPEAMPLDTLDQFATSSTPLYGLAPIWERSFLACRQDAGGPSRGAVAMLT
jgi:hypothetical protein